MKKKTKNKKGDGPPKRKHWSNNLVIFPKKREFRVDIQLQ